MRILDWRPWWVKAGTALWGGQTELPGDSSPTGPSPPRWPASLLGRLSARLMDRRIRGRAEPPRGPFVISVGNLALGGTGKTPVTVGLARALAERGLRGAVLTRGFGSPLAGPLVVDPANDLAGDEARLMAGLLSESRWPVVQARRRTDGLAWLLENRGDLEIVLAEDAHQTAGLGRHLDVLILDRWKIESGLVHPDTGPIFPLGPYREPPGGAERADIWVMETDPDPTLKGVGEIPVATFSRRLEMVNPLAAGESPGAGGRWAALAGIARPARFERQATQSMGLPPVLALRPGDHVAYTPRFADRIAGAMDDAGADLLVTTAKDWVKLKSFWDPDRPVRVADLALEWGHDITLPELVGERLDAWEGRRAR